jgi:hypothetical protein
MNSVRGMALAALVLASPLMAAETAPVPVPTSVTAPAGQVPPVSGPRDEELDEVLVKGTKLWQMRKEIVATEERFFRRYNELNKNDDFDIHCAMEAPTGTRLKSRICREQYIEDAEAEQAQAMLRGEYAPPPEMVRLERFDDYKKNVLQVVNSDQELRKLIRQRDAIEKKYLAERKKRMKGKWILFE